MEKIWVLKRIEEVGIVPVVRASSSDQALATADLIRQGGIPILEVAMSVPGAIMVIAQLSKRFGDEVLVGAGTVLEPETARSCIAAGAQFIVSPALNIPTLELCKVQRISLFSGALTPTEVLTAWEAGADAVNVFPCNAMGGANYVRALKALLPNVKLVPSGGISVKTAKDFITAGAWAIGVGSDLVSSKAVKSGNSESIIAAARSYVIAVREARAPL